MTGRTEEIVSKILKKLVKDYKPERVILFGSYAWGKPNPQSDLDLLVVKKSRKDRIKRFSEVRKLIFDPGRDLVVSPLVLTPAELDERLELGDDFIRDIIEKGIVLYDQKDQRKMAPAIRGRHEIH